LLDDAALFPPGNAPMIEAVAAHRAARAGGCAALIGPFVCPAERVDELDAALVAYAPSSNPVPLEVALVAPAAAAADLTAAVRSVTRRRRLRLAAVEFVLAGLDPAEVRAVVPAGAFAYAEVAPEQLTAPVADALRAAGLRLKLRTGGPTASAFPTVDVLAGALATAVSGGLRFKATAGLHRAVRHRDPLTGFDHHGFLNVLLAVGDLLDGRAAAPTLTEEDGRVLAARAADAAWPDIRRAFRSFGTCSIPEPIGDLRALGLLAEPATR
jgi:hypothetical protein